jgi:hypothetical protein
VEHKRRPLIEAVRREAGRRRAGAKQVGKGARKRGFPLLFLLLLQLRRRQIYLRDAKNEVVRIVTIQGSQIADSQSLAKAKKNDPEYKPISRTKYTY